MAAGLQPFGGGRVCRRTADLYPTHPSGTEAFLRVEGDRLRRFGSVLEPACGPGMITRVLQAWGFDVVSVDLHDYGWGHVAGANFIGQGRHRFACGAVVTNPPYGEDLAEAFIRQAVVELGFGYVAMLLKASFWHADCRRALFEECRPSRIYPLGWRLDWSGAGSPPEEHAWNVWDSGSARFCAYMPSLRRPGHWPEAGWAEWMAGRNA